MVKPITFVDYLILGEGHGGDYLAQRLWRSGRGALLVSPNKAPELLDPQIVIANNQVLSIQQKGIPQGTYRVFTNHRRFRARYLVMCPTPDQPLDFSVFEEERAPARCPQTGLPLLNGELESINMSRLYYLGVQQQAGCPTETAAYLHQILEYRNHRTPMPCRILPFSPDVLARAVLQRISRSGAPGKQQLHGDVIFPDRENNVRYYENIPLDTLPDSGFGKQASFYTVRLLMGEPPEPAANTKLIPELEVRLFGKERDELIVKDTSRWRWDSLQDALCAFFRRSRTV